MKCFTCNGTGNLPYFQHVDGGICYKCEGTGECEVKPAAPVPAKTKAELVAGVRNYIARGIVNNSTRYEMACRLINIRDTATARQLLAEMPAAMRASVIACGHELRAEMAQ